MSLRVNWRQASFQVLADTGILEQAVLFRRYFSGPAEHPFEMLEGDRNWVSGWGGVSMIRDLTSLMPEPLPATGARLHRVWSEEAEHLDDAVSGNDRPRADQAATHLRAAIADTRPQILEFLQSSAQG